MCSLASWTLPEFTWFSATSSCEFRKLLSYEHTKKNKKTKKQNQGKKANLEILKNTGKCSYYISLLKQSTNQTCSNCLSNLESVVNLKSDLNILTEEECSEKMLI